MPMTSASTSSATSSSRSSWTSTSDVEVERQRLLLQAAQVARLERGDDQQHRVGAGRGRLVHLVGVDDEVLAQQRQLRCGARLAQVVERAAEVRGLREDRQRRGAAALVGLDDLRHARARADVPGARGAALVLGDHPDARDGDGLRERAVLARSGELALQVGLRHLALPAVDVVTGRLDDVVEHAHAGASSPVRATKRSSAAAAAPSSMAASAARAPAFERIRAAAGVDRGAGVEHGELARRAGLAGEDRAGDGGVLVRRSAGDRVRARPYRGRRRPARPCTARCAGR